MSKKNFLPPLCLAASLLCSCAGFGARDSGKSGLSGPGAAVIFEKRIFKLSKTPNPGIEAALEGALAGSYQAAVNNHSGDKPMEIGFTYSVAPNGASYPFSEIEVSCIMQEKYARRKGPGLCKDLFQELDLRIKRLREKAGT